MKILMLIPLIFILSETHFQKCVRVVDGDTIILKDSLGIETKIRIKCIDTPERGQAGFKEASDRMKQMVHGKVVRFEPITKDHYGRTVADVFVGDTNVGLQMVKEKYAIVFKKYCQDSAFYHLE